MSQQPDFYERTIYEAKLDICYYARLFVMQECWFARLDKMGTFFVLLASSGAFYAVTRGSTGLTQFLAVAVTAISLARLVFDPAGRARAAHDAKRTYMMLLAQAEDENWSLAKIDAELARIGSESPLHLDGLRMPAFKRNLASHGRDMPLRPLTKWESFLNWFV